MTEEVDDRSIPETLIADIVATEAHAKEIRSSSDRLLASEYVRRLASSALIASAARNFADYAYQCELAARKMRRFAGQLGIEPPDPPD